MTAFRYSLNIQLTYRHITISSILFIVLHGYTLSIYDELCYILYCILIHLPSCMTKIKWFLFEYINHACDVQIRSECCDINSKQYISPLHCSNSMMTRYGVVCVCVCVWPFIPTQSHIPLFPLIQILCPKYRANGRRYLCSNRTRVGPGGSKVRQS